MGTSETRNQFSMVVHYTSLHTNDEHSQSDKIKG